VSVELTVRQSAIQLNTSTNTVQLTQAGNQVVAAGVAGPAGSLGYFGAFSSSVSQTVGAGTAVPMTLNTTDDAVGVSITEGSRVVLSNPGVWNVQFSAQLVNSHTQVHDAKIWLRKNGVDVAQTAGSISVPSSHGGHSGDTIISWNYVLTVGSGSYLQFYWSGDDTRLAIAPVAAGTSPVSPASPSMIVTVCQV